MDVLTQDDLKQLMEITDEHCISFYMPAHRTGREQQQDPIRLRNLISTAEGQLLENGMRRPEVTELMRPIEDLLEDQDFWQHQGDGLAVFRSSSFFKTYRLPSTFDELTVIAQRFHIKPLLPLITRNGQFYILALSLNQVRLLLCTRDTVEELELPNTPTSLREALATDDPEKHLDFHTSTKTPSAAGSRPAIFHGQGTQSDEVEKKNILRYFQLLNAGLNDALDDKTIPMVLACVDYLLPIYHEANIYPHTLKEGLAGNPDELKPRDLLQRAWELVEPIYREKQNEMVNHYILLSGRESELTSDDLDTIVEASHFGRVDTLFVPIRTQRWGRFDTKKNRIKLEETPTVENEDLINFAAVQTLLNSGRVFGLTEEELPGNGEVAAILRYAN